MIKVIGLREGVQNREFDLRDEYEITCMCQTDTSIDNEFVIGFGKGDVIYLQEQGKSLLYGGGPPKKFTIFRQGDKNVAHEG